jgi:CRISPR-associated protein Cmr6
VGMRFQESRLNLPLFKEGTAYEQVGYEVEGELSLLLMRESLEETQEKVLKQLLQRLVQFAMVLGGFGKSWRRADHRLFFEEYYEDDRMKPLIGCHWQWAGEVALRRDSQVRQVEKLGEFIEKVRSVAMEWMRLQGVEPNPEKAANWREAWHPGSVQVWGRLASSVEESEAIRWFHGPYQRAMRELKLAEGSIYRSSSASLTGKVGQIGRLWHRMYPRVFLEKNPVPEGKPIPRSTREFLEFLTIFPDDSRECEQFLAFLEGGPFGFVRLWGER